MPAPRLASVHSQRVGSGTNNFFPRGRTAMYVMLASICTLGIVSMAILGGVNVIMEQNNNDDGGGGTSPHDHVGGGVRPSTSAPSTPEGEDPESVGHDKDNIIPTTPDTFQPEKASLEELHRRIRLDPIGGDVGWRGSGGCGGDGAGGSNHVRLLIGIPTVDNAGGARRRDLQRDSWLKYPEVRNAAGPNHLCKTHSSPPSSSSPFLGSVLVRFLLARHFEPNPTKPPQSEVSPPTPSVSQSVKPYTFSPFSLYESSAFRDMLLFDLDEGKPSNPNKQAGGAGHWGLETEVGMSRKGMYWYLLALRHFSFDYVMKGDDDAFIRVPILIYDLVSKVDPAAIAQREQWLVDNGGEGAAGTASVVANAGGGAHTSKEVHRHHKRPYVYWGIVMKWGARKLTSSASSAKKYLSTFTFVGGMSIIMSKAVVETSVVTDVELYRFSGPFRYFSPTPPTQSSSSTSSIITVGGVKLLHHPISRLTVDSTTLLRLEASSKAVYKEHNLDHEDVMIGRSLYNLAMGYRGGGSGGVVEESNTSDTSAKVKPVSVGEGTKKLGERKKSPSLYTALGITVVADCRFHDVHAGANKRSGVSDTKSVVVHHVRPEEYQQLLQRFPSPLSGGVDAANNTSSSTLKEGSYIGHTIFNLC